MDGFNTTPYLRAVFLTALLALCLLVSPPLLADDDDAKPPPKVPSDPPPMGPIALPGPEIGDIGPQVPNVDPNLSHLLCVGAQIVLGASLEEALEACDDD